MFVPETTNCPPIVQVPLALREVTVAPVVASRLRTTCEEAGTLLLLDTAMLTTMSWTIFRTRKLPLLCSERLPPPSHLAVGRSPLARRACTPK